MTKKKQPASKANKQLSRLTRNGYLDPGKIPRECKAKPERIHAK
jgi:hypothetical protein